MRDILALLLTMILTGNAMADKLTIVAGGTPADEWVEKTSANSVPDTVSKLTDAIEKAGATVFAVVDHAGGASTIGSELAPASLVIFGNPAIGTPIMQENIRAGLDLPLRVLVFEDGRETKITYLNPAVLMTRYQIGGASEAFTKMTGALENLTNAAAN